MEENIMWLKLRLDNQSRSQTDSQSGMRFLCESNNNFLIFFDIEFSAFNVDANTTLHHMRCNPKSYRLDYDKY